MFKKTKICTSLMLAFGSTLTIGTLPAMAQQTAAADLGRVEVTGSRIKRAEAEGALPVTVITREELEASGQTTVAEVIRNITFSSQGQFRPQSGSSFQSFSGVSLRGLGTNRTLVLVDGKRVAKSPNVGDSADMNSIPMAAVERIEILTDGASAIYGSDAIGGVVNIILRKNFDGVHVSYEETKPVIKGGDRKAASVVLGVQGENGRLVAGASKTSRDIIFVRDYPWGAPVGASSFSNGFYKAVPDGDGGFLADISGGGYLGTAGTCDFPDKGFYLGTDAKKRCRYDFNLVASDEASTSAKSVFARGEYKIGRDWTAFLTASNTQNSSFGRYAPVPDTVLIQPDSVANLVGATEPIFLAHRFAAAGNRDTYTDSNLNDVGVGVQGSFNSIDLEFGARRTSSKYIETGRGFVVKGLATAAINNGSYNIVNPFLNSDATLKSITTTTGRDAIWSQSDLYANATVSVFKLAGGDSRLYLGVENSRQTYADIYDSLSEAGEVLGSSGSSAGGSRKVSALSAEWLMPFTKNLEATLSGRYEKYSDYGSDFSPKASVRYQVTPTVTLRASAGKGFRAPSLPELTQKPSFSADTVVDPRHCLADGAFTEAECQVTEFQINGLHISNPTLTSEKSTQFALGAVWDVTPALSLKVDYWNTKIDGVINSITAQEIVDRDNGDSPLAIPPGLSIKRDPVTGSILQIVSGSTNEGVLQYSGVDLSVLFSHKYASVGSFKHELSWSQVLDASINSIDQNGTFGQPKSRGTLKSHWTYGPLETTWNVNYIAKNGERDGDFAGAYTTHDLQVGWNTPLKGLKLTVGALNVGNKYPALVGSPYDQKPFNYYLYDAYGRQYYLRGEMKF